MIYTLGKTEAYERYFRDNYPVPTYKLGRRLLPKKYPGGSVWQTREDAQRFADINPGFSVYTVDADWITDTVPSSDGDWHDLLRDAVIVESLAVIEQIDEELQGIDG